MAFLSERRFISMDNIQSGMFLEFKYVKESDGAIKSYKVLVIDPQKINENTSQKYLHALLIDDFSDEDLMTLIVSLSGEFNYDPDSRDAPLGNLQTDESYRKFVSKYSNTDIYRTFKLTNMSTVRQILTGAV